MNQELLFERIRIQLKYLKFKSKLAFKYGPYWTKTNYHKPKFHQKNFLRCKSFPLSAWSNEIFLFSRSFLFIYSNANHLTWVKRVLSYYYYLLLLLLLFFFFLIRVYQDLGIWVLSAIRICLRIFVFLFRSLRHFVKHLGLAYFHKGYQFLYHSLTIIPAKHEKEKELQREKARKPVNLSNKIGFWITYERLCMFWIKGRSFIYKIK